MVLTMRSTYLLAAVVLTVGCSNAQQTECRVGADCLSGMCNYDGTCSPVKPPVDGGEEADPDAQPAETSTDEDAPTADVAPDGNAGSCTPNHDGIITREEIPLRPGLHATFKIATNAPVDTVGTQSGGITTWDLSGELAGDHLSIVELQEIAGSWFAPKFPNASYASRLSDTETLLGVFQITDTQLLLLGVVSPEAGTTRTELVYDPPVITLSFPIQSAATWTSTSKVTGVAMGMISSYTETYESQVDASGTLATPYGSFAVQRIQTLLTRTVAMVPTTTRTFLFATECFGTVAAITSKSNEKLVEFTTAAEVKRLSP
jgi:hypothetical protein